MCSLGPSSLRVCKTDPRRIWPSTRPRGASFSSRISDAAGIVCLTMWYHACQTRSLRMMTSSGAQFMRLAAALTMFFFTSCAARSAALPAMNVTRLEYEPRSMGVRSVSAAMTFTRAKLAAQHLGHNLRGHGVGALPDLRRAGVNHHAAIAIDLDVHRRVRHVGADDAVGRAAHIVAASHAQAASLGQLAFALLPARARDHLIDALRQAVAQHAQAVHRDRRRLQQIDAPHFSRIEIRAWRQSHPSATRRQSAR